jgi:Carboxypeptidase regulatory-like domain
VMKSRVFVFVLAVLCLAGPVMAQGQQSGTLSGRLASSDNLALPGATVTVSSSALQGVRTVVSDINGVYSLQRLPPGDYVVTFEMDGMSSVERHAQVSLGGVVTMDQALTVAAVSEVVVVNGARPAPVSSPAGAFNVRADQFSLMPTGRTVFGIAELAPGLTDNTPNNNQVTVAGGFAYDNVFLMDGVDINDNVLGQPNALFIEDAIQEVQVLTSGVSAEYGRFGGGVVNVITKSGSNLFSGAFRTNVTNPAWSTETPFEKGAGTTHASKLSPTYEATFGGPVTRDRVWFFGGSRVERTTTQGTFAQTRTPYTSHNDNTRYEAKLTGTIANGHTLQGTFVDNTTDLVQPAIPSATIDPAAMTTPSTLNRLFATTWRGVLGSKTFATAQYSQKVWKLQNAGGTTTAVLDSPFMTRGVTAGVPGGLQYNAPYFDSTDPEQRNNRQFTASVTEMLASRRGGTHEIKGGFEYFVSTRVGGNSQTSTGYVFQTDYALDADARPALDASGDLIPRFVPGSSRVQVWQPLRPVRPRCDVWRAGVAVAAPVGEARGAERDEQPAAGLVGYLGYCRHGGPEGRQRTAVELHHRSEFRQGHVERPLRAAAPGHRRRPDVRARGRDSVLVARQGTRDKGQGTRDKGQGAGRREGSGVDGSPRQLSPHPLLVPCPLSLFP